MNSEVCAAVMTITHNAVAVKLSIEFLVGTPCEIGSAVRLTSYWF